MIAGTTLITNGLTLALALGFLLILLWHDAKRQQNQVFALFLLMVVIWNVGSLMMQTAILLQFEALPLTTGLTIIEIGFMGASAALYALVTVLVGAHSRELRVSAMLSFALAAAYRVVFLAVAGTHADIASFDPAAYRLEGLPFLFFAVFNGVTLSLTYQMRRKFRSGLVISGVVIFSIGQGLAFLNPEIAVVSLATTVSAIGALIISLAILRQEIITPLAERGTQVETMHRVSLAVISQLAIDVVLNEIVKQAAGWLEADGAGLFLRQADQLELVTVHELPPQMLHARIALGQGVAGTVAQTRKTMYLENYGRDWKGAPDLPLARETFGALICVPLVYGAQVIGALMVIAGRQGRLFRREDANLLELLGAQAAVAIAHSRLFEEQRKLFEQIEDARQQLETLLTSTENPVVAVDRRLNLIFANPAARRLFMLPPQAAQMADALPAVAFPANRRTVMRDIHTSGAHIYEISLDGKTYLCHLAAFGKPRLDGWVAVMNDVTQLKELDRLKSEMVRMVSHDLKNPLMGAMLYLDLLADSALPTQREHLQVIERQLERMNRIIRGVLDLEKIRTVEMKRDVCYAGQMIDVTLAELRRLADDKQITLTSDVRGHPLAFVGDNEQFERALVNLVENAIKFTPDGGTVTLAAYPSDDHVFFEVRDTGIGIPEDMHDRIFERFFRARQKGVEHVTGSGLGLSIVQTIVENHRGKVWLKSEVEAGTTFYISVPMVSVSEPTL